MLSFQAPFLLTNNAHLPRFLEQGMVLVIQEKVTRNPILNFQETVLSYHRIQYIYIPSIN